MSPSLAAQEGDPVVVFLPILVAGALAAHFVFASREKPKWKVIVGGIFLLSLAMRYMILSSWSPTVGIVMQCLLAVVLLMYYKVN